MKKALQNRINLANKYIEFAIKHNIMGEDYFGGTFPTLMTFEKPIKVSSTGRVVTVSWKDGYGMRPYTEKFNPNKSFSEEELRYTINGIIRGIKKGAKEDGWILSHKGQSFSAQRANPQKPSRYDEMVAYFTGNGLRDYNRYAAQELYEMMIDSPNRDIQEMKQYHYPDWKPEDFQRFLIEVETINLANQRASTQDNFLRNVHNYCKTANESGDFLERVRNVELRTNPSDTFIQDAFEEIDKDGTEGAFTRYVAANYYGENTPAKREAVAQDIVKKYKAWSKKGKKGKAPFSLRTYRRAIFYLNIQKN